MVFPEEIRWRLPAVTGYRYPGGVPGTRGIGEPQTEQFTTGSFSRNGVVVVRTASAFRFEYRVRVFDHVFAPSRTARLVAVVTPVTDR